MGRVDNLDGDGQRALSSTFKPLSSRAALAAAAPWRANTAAAVQFLGAFEIAIVALAIAAIWRSAKTQTATHNLL